MSRAKRKASKPRATRATRRAGDAMIPAQTDMGDLDKWGLGQDEDPEHRANPDWEELSRQLRPTTRPHSRPANILAAMVWDASSDIQRGKVILPGGSLENGLSEKGYATLFENADELRKKLGAAMLDAFVAGQRGFADQVLKAFKQLDVLFRRNHSADLVRRLMPHTAAIERACHTKAARRAAVEAEIGRKLYNEEWNRLQTAMHWTRVPKGKAGRSHKRD